MANTSFNLANPSYNWNYGDGTFATIQNGLVTYSDSGTFNVVLTVTNTFGCSDSISQTITVNHSPVAAASTMDTTGCSPYSSQFSNATTYADSYLWMFGDGDTSSASSPIHTYLTGGNYYPILIAFNSFGCSDTFYFSQPIVVNQTPSVSFNSNAINGCINTSFQFNDQSTFLQAPVFNWDFTFTNSSLQNPLITYTNPGFYNVALTVTNSNGCSSTLTMPTYIEIFDTIPPSADPILSVSVIDDSNLEVKWSNSSFNDLGQYVLYRFNTMTNVYDLIYTDNSPQHSSVAPTSSYIDSNLNTKDSTYTYLLQTVDRCNFKLPLISLIAHTSMNVTALQAGVDIQVNWTPYLGGTVSGYTITRTEVANGSSAIVSTVNASTFSYLDTSLYCPFPYSYRITANDINGNAYLSLSDTSNATPLDLLAGQHVDVVRSTVIFNKYVLTEWLPPTLLPNRVAYYDILRSTDSVNYSSVGTAPALATSYTDNNVKVNDQNYYYKVIVVNDCSLQGPQSGEGTSILLNGEWRNFKTHLNWTKYKAWNLGVDNYTIEKLNDSGIWEFVKSVDGNTTNSEIDD